MLTILRALSYLLPAFWLVTDRKGKGLRDTVVSNANKVVGYSASSQETGEAFRKLLGAPPQGSDWDLSRPFHVADGHTTGVSTCGLVTRGIHVLSGLLWPEYFKPYIPGRVFTDMVGKAQKCGAWRTSGLPNYGDAFIIGQGYQTHMATCINVDGREVLSVDGGQEDRATGLQCIRQISRDFSQVHLQGIIDVEILAKSL
jgi:hypothetical protein